MSPSTVREKPIIFSAAMVNALLADRKLQTRRLNGLEYINEAPDEWTCSLVDDSHTFTFVNHRTGEVVEIECPWGPVGTVLWVRENWRTLAMWDSLPPRGLPGSPPVRYEADAAINGPTPYPYGKLRPGMFLLQSLARIRREVTALRCGRLQKITEADAIAEGVEPEPHPKYPVLMAGGGVRAFKTLWESLNGAGSWKRNDYLWVVSFRKIEVTR